MKLVIYPAVSDEALAQVRAIDSGLQVVNAQEPEHAVQAIREAEAFYGNLSPEMFAQGRQLKWIQAPVAGLEKYLFPALRESKVALTNMRGIFSDHIADHVFAFVLTFARSLHKYLRKQLRHQWEPNEPVIHLSDCTLGIIGFGGIGQAVAKRGVGHEMRVIAVDVMPKLMDNVEVWPMERLNDLLSESDFVVSCVPHTPETEKLIGTPQFQKMKHTAYLINISRGIVVDLQALTDALTRELIAGAALDVFEIEPLPADHALWRLENVLITPHTAGHSPHYHERRLKVFLENLRRFVKDEPLVNVVDKTQWFAHEGELPETR